MSPMMERKGKLTRMTRLGSLWLWPDQKKVLERMSRVRGKSMAGIIRELVDQGTKGIGEKDVKEILKED